MPWQRQALTGQLEFEVPGSPLSRTSLVSVARQNGKSVCLAGLCGWWLTHMAAIRGTPQTVVSTAHSLDLAVSLFQQLAPILEARFGAKSKWSYGRNELTMPDGSTWLIRAATPSAGHGRSIDLVLIDECWDVSSDVIDQGLLPAQRARKSPLCSMWSTAGTEASAAMLRWRSSGLAAIDAGEPGSHYFAEWSVPEGVDPSDSEYWHLANPAIGHTLDLSVLEAEAAGPNRAAFLRASLNLWVSSDRAWLDPGVWDRAVTEAPAGPLLCLAVDSSQDGQRFVGVGAHAGGDGQTLVRVEFVVNTEAELWTQTETLLGSTPGAMLAVTPGLQIHVPPGLERRATTVGYGELVKWTTLVKSMILEGRIVHHGQLTLSEHMGRAVAVKTNNGWSLSSQKSPGPIELARCAVWAAALSTKPKWTSRPAMATARS
jgi:hypothetical protein